MTCKKCGGNRDDGPCRICDMLMARTPPGHKVDEAPIAREKVRLSDRELAAPKTRPADTWQVSEALAVHPNQVAQANARNKKHGIATQYDRRGMAHIPSRADRKKLLKLEGFKDNVGGYGD